MKSDLGFLYIRGRLFNNIYNDRVKESFEETYQEVEKLETNFGKFMLEMMKLSRIELEHNNLKIAAYDINILHNLPETIYNIWDEDYFYRMEVLGYIDIMSENGRPDKIKKLISLVSNFLIQPRSVTELNNKEKIFIKD